MFVLSDGLDLNGLLIMCDILVFARDSLKIPLDGWTGTTMIN